MCDFSNFLLANSESYHPECRLLRDELSPRPQTPPRVYRASTRHHEAGQLQHKHRCSSGTGTGGLLSGGSLEPHKLFSDTHIPSVGTRTYTHTHAYTRCMHTRYLSHTQHISYIIIALIVSAINSIPLLPTIPCCSHSLRFTSISVRVCSSRISLLRQTFGGQIADSGERQWLEEVYFPEEDLALVLEWGVKDLEETGSRQQQLSALT